MLVNKDLLAYRWIALFGLLTITFNVDAFAGKYTDRPDILKQKSLHHPDLENTIPGWQAIKEGQVEAVAELLGAYADSHIYFLARDGEPLYDLARFLLTKEGDKKALERIHLLNVSREHIGQTGKSPDPHLKDYLAQEGISKAAFKEGKKVLFVDTGYKGSIPNYLSGVLNHPDEKQFKTHLLTCEGRQFPSTRVFLQSIDKNAATMPSYEFHSKLADYENMPKYFDRSNSYSHLDGKWIPMTPEGRATPDGVVSNQKAVEILEDLRAYVDLHDTLEHFKERKKFWEDLGTKIHKNTSSEVEALLKKLLKTHDPRKESIVQDAYEIITRNFKEYPQAIPDLSQLGIKAAEHPPEVLSEEVRQALKDQKKTIQNLHSTDLKVSRKAAEELMDQALSSSQHWQISNWASDALGKVLPSYPDFHQKLAQLIMKPDTAIEIKQKAIQLLAKSQSHDTELQLMLVDQINSKDHNSCTLAEFALKQLQPKDPKIFEAIVNLLSKDNAQTRNIAGRLIKELDPTLSRFRKDHPRLALTQYLNQNCDRSPIQDVLSTEMLQSVIDSLSMSKNKESKEKEKEKSMKIRKENKIAHIQQQILDLLNNPKCEKQVLALFDLDETLLSSGNQGEDKDYCQKMDKNPTQDHSCLIEDEAPGILKDLSTTPGVTTAYLTARGIREKHSKLNQPEALTELTERELQDLGFPNHGSAFQNQSHNQSKDDLHFGAGRYSVRKDTVYTNWTDKGPFVAHLFSSDQKVLKERKKCVVMVDNSDPNISNIADALSRLPESEKPEKALLIHYTHFEESRTKF